MDDNSLIKILAAAPNPGEDADEATARKERVMGALFGRLSVVEARGMWLRLSRLREGDPLSETFARFPSSMRERLMAFLVDEPRLKAVAAQAAR